jgi:hypothetical protein
MSASPFDRSLVRPDRGSDAPMALDLTDSQSLSLPPGWGSLASRIPASWLGMSGYLIAGVFLGLVLIVALSFGRANASTSAASAGVVTDNIVHLDAAQINSACWRGAAKDGPARLTVALEVGLDGKVRNAVAAGESATMRGCIEAHVKSWEFLPQATASQMVLPFEIAPR